MACDRSVRGSRVVLEWKRAWCGMAFRAMTAVVVGVVVLVVLAVYTVGTMKSLKFFSGKDVVDGQWRKAVCKTSPATLPSFPYLLPKFSPSPEAKNIFFVETTCTSVLNPKMACVVESAARHHPTHQVHLALTSPYSSLGDAFMDALYTVPNVRISSLDLDDMKDSGRLYQWLGEMEWAKGKWPEINLSDILRVFVVCATGGTYLDLDMLIAGALPDAAAWLTFEKWDLLTNSAFKLPKDHWFCQEAEDQMLSDFNPMVWAYNGPMLFQKIIGRTCNADVTVDLHQCRNLTLLDPHLLFAIHWSIWEKYFEPGGARNWTRPHEMVGVHLWNSISSRRPLQPGDGSIVDVVSRQNCPKVYKTTAKAWQTHRALRGNRD